MTANKKKPKAKAKVVRRKKIRKSAAPKEKSRKEDYAEKKADKNPLNMTEAKILNGLKEGTIIAGDPPKNKKFSSEQWKMGIKFLYDADSNEEIKNWYFCEKCAWVQNVLLGGGTGNLLKHARQHLQETYKFTKSELVELLIRTSNYTSSTNATPNFNKVLPKQKDW